MSKKTFDDIAKSEVRAIEKTIRQTAKRMNEISNEYILLDEKHDQLLDDLEQAKKQASSLKRFIWNSNNPNIVELRNEILLAAKLIKDNP